MEMTFFLNFFRSIELNVLYDTYNRQSIEVLRQLDRKMDLKCDSVKNLLYETNQKLSCYSGVDAKFFELLNTYNNLQKEIKFFKTLAP